LKNSLFQRASPRTLVALIAAAGWAAPLAAQAQSAIDTNSPSYIASELGASVLPTFRGGVLETDQAGASYAYDFTLDGSGTNTIDLGSVTTTFAGVFSDETVGTPGSLIIQDSIGNGSIILSGASTYTGATTVRAGTLSLTGSISASSGVNLAGSGAVFDISNLTAASTQINNLSGVAGSQVRLGAKGLTVNQTGATTFAGEISATSGASSFIKTGAGTLTLTGTNTYSGVTTISAGTLALSGTGSIAASTQVTVNDVLDISATTAGASIYTLAGTGTVALGGQTLTLSTAADTFDGIIAGTGGLTVAGGAETLTGTNTYSGATTINTGASLSLSGTGAIAASSSVAVNGTFDISATTSGASTGALSGSGQVVLGGETLTVTQGSGSFSGNIDGTGGLAITGGTQTLSGANTFTGGTQISGGRLIVGNSNALGSGPVAVSGGALDLGGTNLSTGVLSLTGGSIVDSVGGGALRASAFDLHAGQIAAVLAGSAALTQNGPGKTVLSAANTYTGVTTISHGVLALSGAGSISSSSRVVDNATFDISATRSGASITTLSGAGAVVLGGQTLTLTRAADTFDGAIGGTGGLTIAAGSETLTGANTFTGAATINAGASLALSGAGSLATASGVTVNGTFDISASASDPAVTSLSGTGHVALGDRTLILASQSGNFTGDIAGTGGLGINGGLHTLRGVNTFTGNVVVTGSGILAVQSDAALGGPTSGIVLDGGILRAAGDLATARTIRVATGGGAIQAEGGAIDLNGVVRLDGDLTTGGGRIVLSGLIQGGGALTMADGLFYDNGVIDAGAVTVANGATLRGVGTVNAPTLVRGTLAPGASPGTLTFNAPVTLAASAISQFDIDGVGTGAGLGSHSRVIVNGAGGTFTASGVLAPRLRGMTGSASNSYVPPIGQAFQVISAAGGIAPASSFSGLTQPQGLAAGTRFDAIYAPTTLSLVATPAAYADLGAAGIAQTGNQKAIGAALDADRSAAGVRTSAARAAIYDPLYGLSAGQISAALNGLSPEVYAVGLMAARQAWRGTTAAVGDQLADRRGADSAGPAEVTVWGGAFSHAGDTGPSGASYSTSAGGLVIGVDRMLEEGGAIGLALGLAKAKSDMAGGASARGDVIQAMAYGGARKGRGFLDWQVDYLRTDQDLTRAGGPLRGSVAGDKTLQGAGAQVSAGLTMTLQTWRVEPTLSLAALRLTSTSTHEAPEAALAEDIAGQRNDSVQSFVGVRLARMVQMTPDLSFRARGLFGWSHEMADTGGEARASLAKIGGTAFTAASASAGRDAARLGAGFDAQLTPKITLYGSYAADLAHEGASQDLTVGVRALW
jgi:fibronectin-binding autotransporter adhesin